MTVLEALDRPGGRTHTFAAGPFAGTEALRARRRGRGGRGEEFGACGGSMDLCFACVGSRRRHVFVFGSPAKNMTKTHVPELRGLQHAAFTQLRRRLSR